MHQSELTYILAPKECARRIIKEDTDSEVEGEISQKNINACGVTDLPSSDQPVNPTEQSTSAVITEVSNTELSNLDSSMISATGDRLVSNVPQVEAQGLTRMEDISLIKKPAQNLNLLTMSKAGNPDLSHTCPAASLAEAQPTKPSTKLQLAPYGLATQLPSEQQNVDMFPESHIN